MFLVELPVLDNEMYHAVKPGLSAYKDNPEEVRVPAKRFPIATSNFMKLLCHVVTP